MWKTILSLISILAISLVIYQIMNTNRSGATTFAGNSLSKEFEGFDTVITNSTNSTTPATNNGAKTTIYSSTPEWLSSQTTTTQHPLIQAAITNLSTSPPNITDAVANIQKALDDKTEKYSKDPSQLYIDAIHQLTAALHDLRGSPIDVVDAITQLKSAITTLDKIPQGQLQQNCFNQNYIGSVCPQSVIDTFSVNKNVFKNANDSFVQCLESTRNTQYGTLLGKLKQIQSLLDQL
jgi:hypothetical protein